MRELMFVQIGRVDEGGGTLRTLVGFFTCVSAHMHHQVVLVFAFVGAQVTEEVESVRMNQPVHRIN